MKKLIVGGLAALAISLIGCSNSGADSVAVSTTPQTVTQTVVTTSVLPHGGITDQDRVFLAEISEDEYFDNVERETLFWSGHHFCDEAHQGRKAEPLNELLEKGMSLEHVTNLVSAAYKAYCPDQLTGVQ